MTTLAKQFLESDPDVHLTPGGSKRLLQMQVWTYEFIKERLLAPLPGADGVTADQCAERFIFEVDAPAVTGELVKANAIEDKLIWDTFHWPATNFWLEYPCNDHLTDANDCVERVGIMVGRVALNETVMCQYKYMMAVVCGGGGTCRVAALFSLDDRLIRPGESYMHVHWFLNRLATEGRASDSENQDAKQFVFDLGYALFLINTPRVGELRTTTFGSPPRKKSRMRDGENTIPLTEVRRVVLKVGIAPPRYDRSGRVGGTVSETSEERTKRLHRVIGHFRTYRKDREEPHVAYVPQHWRGDAEKGILLHERVVKR